MKVLRVPRNLLWLSWSYWVVPLLLALHVAAASRAEWWRLPWKAVGIAAAVGGFFAGLFFLGTRRQRLWLPVSARVFFVAWIGVAIWVALRELSTALGAFCVGLVGYALPVLSAIDRERARSFLDPRMQWFEGKPRLIPGLQARIYPLAAPSPEVLGEGAGEVSSWRAARFDREGVFLFASDSEDGPIPSFVMEKPRVKLEISYRGTHLKCEAEPVAALYSRRGVGFRLRPLTIDESTTLGKLVEAVRGEGYEQG